MKEKGFKKYTKEKGKAQSARVSKPKKRSQGEIGLGSQKMPKSRHTTQPKLDPNGWREKPDLKRSIMKWGIRKVQSKHSWTKELYRKEPKMRKTKKKKQKKKVKATGRELSNQQQKILAIWEKWQEWKAAKKAEIIKRTK